MNSIPFQSAPPPPWFPMVPPNRPPSSVFWETSNVHDQVRDLHDTLNLAKAMQEELEMLIMLKDAEGSIEDADADAENPGTLIARFSKHLKEKRIKLDAQELFFVAAANSIMSKLKIQLGQFKVITDESVPWEEKSAAVRLANKVQKSKRNKLWRKRKRKRVAEIIAKECERFEQADQEADEWRAREIAKDIAERKVKKMKEIADLKAKEERKKLEFDLELVLMVEKLQELRSIRIQKLKKQGHFLPEEDDKFLERVRAAVEVEEYQVMAAADANAAKDAIATAEESRKTSQSQQLDHKDLSSNEGGTKENYKEMTTENRKGFEAGTANESMIQGSVGQSYGGAYESLASLPMEFYHYYHGSSNDMGTLIEVRRTWDAYIRPGGSRIPGHWVQPPPPADEIWESYLVKLTT